MINFFRCQSKPAEAPLWDLLDACGLPFREPLGIWLDQFHSQASVWSDTLEYSIPDNQVPLFDGLDSLIHAQFDENTDLDQAPDYLSGAVRGAGDHRLNYAKAIAGLTRALGKGKENSKSNTVSRIWNLGLARVECTVWPPDKQQKGGRNDRHRLFPETIEEAHISIHPAWRAPLEEERAVLLKEAKLLWTDTSSQQGPSFGKFARQVQNLGAGCPLGLSLLPGHALIRHYPADILDWMPLDQLTGLNLDRIEPGRGGAQCDLYLRHQATIRAGARDTKLSVASMSGTSVGLDQLAEDLATQLDLQLKTWTGVSD